MGTFLVLSSLGLTACVPPGFACSAVGYLSVAKIALAEPTAGVELELCDGAGCVPGPPMAPVEMQPARTTAEPIIEDTGVFTLVGDGVSGWSADFVGGQSVVGYRLTNTARGVVVEGTIDVDWVRVGGTERCGGPREADIELPS